MSAIVDSIMLGTIADEDRFRAMINAAIESKEVPSLSAFRKGAKTSAGSQKSAAKRKAKTDKVTALKVYHSSFKGGVEYISGLRVAHSQLDSSQVKCSCHASGVYTAMVNVDINVHAWYAAS